MRAFDDVVRGIFAKLGDVRAMMHRNFDVTREYRQSREQSLVQPGGGCVVRAVRPQ
jgi:hypothetical protein